MSPTYKPLQVEAIAGERMTFFVHSERNPRSGYRIDLLAHGGIGECSCKDWHTRRWPVIRDGGEATCKHVDECRRVFLRDLLSHMAKGEAQP